MSTFLCERCGGDGTVTVATARPNRGRPQPPPVAHHYCRECAKALGVPLLDRRALPPDVVEGLAIWSEIETALAHIERDLRTAQSAGDTAAVEAAIRHVEFFKRDLPAPVPTRVRAAFARVGFPIESTDA